MAWFKSAPSRAAAPAAVSAPLALERLESRTLLDATAALAAGVLTVTGDAANDYIALFLDATQTQIVVSNNAQGVIGQFDRGAVGSIAVNAGEGNNVVRINNDILQPATLTSGAGNDVLYAGGGTTSSDAGGGINRIVGGSSATTMTGGGGINRMFGAQGVDTFNAGPGANLFWAVKSNDIANANASTMQVLIPGPLMAMSCQEVLTAAEVGVLLQRAAGASVSTDAIIAIVDRNGTILGVRVEAGVINSSGFAIDGAIAKARTGAFFGNNQAPLTSRTIQFISQSTITQREVMSNPNLDRNAFPTLYGPGYVAPVGVGGHFPPGVPFTPQVDLFGIEHTNRDSETHQITMTTLMERFNIDPAFVPAGQSLAFPNAYDYVVNGVLTAQNRGIATLPGGIPLYKNGCMVGGIGVFFPGATGFATEENSSLSSTFNPLLPDRSMEAEWIAFAAAGATADTAAGITLVSGALPTLNGFVLPNGRIDLVGITLPLFGPGGRMGIENLFNYALANIRPGNINDGANVPVMMGGATLLPGMLVPEGTLVTSHDGIGQLGVNLTAADVDRIIQQGIAQEQVTRAQIRTPAGTNAKYVYAVTDLEGNVLGLYRTPDATVFSIDVAVAKARNVAYYANGNLLQAPDQVQGLPVGAAATNRTFRYLALPRFPEGIDGFPPGPFSVLNDGGADLNTGLFVGPPLPASAYQSVLGYDSFNPGTNFRNPVNINNQNGIVFFPGSVPLYKLNAAGQYVLVGGLGVSGDGVDEDDVVTFFAAQGFYPPDFVRADNFFVRGVRLPFQRFNRNPEAF